MIWLVLAGVLAFFLFSFFIHVATNDWKDVLFAWMWIGGFITIFAMVIYGMSQITTK